MLGMVKMHELIEAHGDLAFTPPQTARSRSGLRADRSTEGAVTRRPAAVPSRKDPGAAQSRHDHRAARIPASELERSVGETCRDTHR